MKSKELLEKDKEYIIRGWNSIAEPVVVRRGDGIWVEDADGNKYIDCSSGLFVMGLGHNPREVIDAIKKQTEELIQISMRQSSIPAVLLAEKVSMISPGLLKRIYYTTGGSEANEVALKMAKSYKRKYEVVALKNAYHGLTLGALTLTSSMNYRRGFGPLMAGVIRIPNAYCYRCMYSYPNCELWCAKELERILEDKSFYTSSAGDICSIILEPVQGAGGIIPPDGWLREIRRICDRFDILFIADEIQTGFGRTGKMFAVEHWDVVPDIMTLAKGIGGGIPLGCALTTEEIAKDFSSGTTPTSAGNPIACRAGLAHIESLEEKGICDHALQMGRYLKGSLEDSIPRKYLGEVRFKGLMGGVELVEDRVTKAPLPKGLMAEIKKRLLEHAIIVSTSGPLGNVLRIQPPLVITQEEIEFIVTSFKEVILETLGSK